MKNKIVLLISILLATASTMTHADEGDDDDDQISAADILLERTLPASAALQPLHVIVHKAGHLEDRPFVVDVSELCPQNGTLTPRELDIDTISACDIAVNTLAFDPAAGELSIQVREPSAEGVCSPKPKKIVMQLRTMCNEVD